MQNKKPKTFKIKINAVTLRKNLRSQLIREIAGYTKTHLNFNPPIACIDNNSPEDPLFYIDSISRNCKNSPVKVKSSTYDKKFDLLLCSTEDLIRIHYKIMKL